MTFLTEVCCGDGIEEVAAAAVDLARDELLVDELGLMLFSLARF